MDQNKENLIFTRRHWASFFGSFVLVLFLIILPIVIFILVVTFTSFKPSGFVPNFLLVAVSVYYMTMTTFAFTEFISFYYDILMVTEDEVIEIAQTGVFDRRITEISLLRIQDVSAEVRGVIPTFFGYGDVVVESAGENTQKYIIKSIPHPVEVANKILQLHREQIEHEERHREVVVAEGDFRKPKIDIVKQDIEQDNGRKDVEQKDIEQKVDEIKIDEVKKNSANEGDISKDDLDKGGEIKF